jgi:hypothetical protein
MMALHYAAAALDRAYMNPLIPARTIRKMERIAWPKRPKFRRREWENKRQTKWAAGLTGSRRAALASGEG